MATRFEVTQQDLAEGLAARRTTINAAARRFLKAGAIIHAEISRSAMPNGCGPPLVNALRSGRPGRACRRLVPILERSPLADPGRPTRTHHFQTSRRQGRKSGALFRVPFGRSTGQPGGDPSATLAGAKIDKHGADAAQDPPRSSRSTSSALLPTFSTAARKRSSLTPNFRLQSRTS